MANRSPSCFSWASARRGPDVSDNIFDRLADLLASPGPVNWKLAAELARSIAGPPRAVPDDDQKEFEELTRAAQLHIEQAARLPIDPTPVQIAVVDQRGWAEANLEQFRYLIEPLAQKLSASTNEEEAGGLGAIFAGIWPAILGLQAGGMVGYLSKRVLGQFDVGLPVPGVRSLYYVAPNIDEFADGHELDRSQARLWVALHEVTHHVEFSVPWVEDHFRNLIARYFAGVELDVESMSLPALDDPEELQRMLSDPSGITGILAGPGQQEVLEEIQAFMALMEGFAEHLMDVAAPGLLPEIPRLREAVERRRATPSQAEELVSRLIGLEMKREQYRLGAEFCRQVESRWGPEALRELWSGPEMLPTLAELEDPVAWAARALLPEI